MVFIFSFRKQKKEEKSNLDNVKEVLDPPQEVPDLAMEKFQVDEEINDSNENINNSIDIKKNDDDKEKNLTTLKKPQDSLPPIDSSKFEQKKEVSFPQKEIINHVENESSDDKKNEQLSEKNKSIMNKTPEEKNQFQQPQQKKRVISNINQSGKFFRYPKFFSRIKEKFENDKFSDMDNILESMKKYHEINRKDEKNLEKKEFIDSIIAKKLYELELLEEGWYLLKREIETKHLLLKDKEDSINVKIEEFKYIMENLKAFENKKIPKDKWFVLNDGRKLRTIDELKESLKVMENNIFSHHVNQDKNDFYSWILHVFNDAKLAEKIMSAKTKDELVNVLEKE